MTLPNIRSSFLVYAGAGCMTNFKLMSRENQNMIPLVYFRLHFCLPKKLQSHVNYVNERTRIVN